MARSNTSRSNGSGSNGSSNRRASNRGNSRREGRKSNAGRNAIFGLPSTRFGVMVASGLAVGLIGGIAYMVARPKIAYAPGLDYLPANPPHDVFGNTGEDNMVEPLTLLDDENFMSDDMNPHKGLI